MSVVYGAAAHFGAKPLWEVYEYEKRDICLPAIFKFIRSFRCVIPPCVTILQIEFLSFVGWAFSTIQASTRS